MTKPTEPPEPTEPQEPAEPQEESADEAEEHDEDNLPEHEREQEDEPQAPPPAEQSQGLSEKEIETRFEKLDKEKQRHAKRIGEILEEDAQELVPCELCWPPAPGFRFPQMPEEQREAVMVAIGFAAQADLEAGKDSRQCPDCNGWGEVKTGSRVQGNAIMKCTSCDGVGAVGERFASGSTPQVPQAPPVAVNGPRAEVPVDANKERLKREALAAGLTVFDPPPPAPA